MFRRLFSSSYEFDKVFQEAKADATHNLVHPKKIVDLASRHLTSQNRQNIHININIQHNVNNQINININNGGKGEEKKNQRDKKNSFVEFFIKKVQNKNMVLKIKMLVVSHAILKRIQNEEFNQALIRELQKMMVDHSNPQEKQDHRQREKVEIKVENTKQDFMQRNIIAFYCFYLKKLMINMDTYLFAKTYNPAKYQSKDAIQIINRGFLVLNLVNYILRSQYTFNKMGRYYISHKQLLALFMKYLQDLIIYNSFIKKTSALALNSIKQAGQEEVKHFFLFVTEAQKTSDRLYEFFYNRYYYNEVKNMIMMPTFLTIHADQYKEIVSQVKRKDRELVVLVRKSKYESGNGRSYSCTAKTSRTIQDQNQFMKTEGNSFSISSLSYGIPISQMGEKEKRRTNQGQRKRCKTTYKR